MIKGRRTAAITAAALAALATVAIVGGQSASGWDLSWNAITGGGGRSSGEGYHLQGAIVPVSGQSAGGDYVVTGGFFGGEQEVEFKAFLPGLARDGAN